MLNNIKNLKWIGDISLEDADLLAFYGRRSKTVLEFGCGGSTQLFSQCGPAILSVDTDPNWISATTKRLSKIENHSTVEFCNYTTQFNKTFDLIFVDGDPAYRRQFAIDTWQYLNVNGVMIFHDTRHFEHFQHAMWVAQLYHNEISRIDANATADNGQSSNLTIIHKKAFEGYVNWNYTENKPWWAYGTLDGDQDLWVHTF